MMFRMSWAAAAVALINLAAFGLCWPADAEQVTWFGNRNEDGASLVYGTPDSGFGRIAFTCQAGQDDLIFIYEHEPVGAENGINIEVFLSAGNVDVSIPTTGSRLEIDDVFLLEGQTKLNGRLRDILTSDGTLTVLVADSSAEYPLDTIRQAAQDILDVCSPDG